jgi:hypothetical protein
MAAFKPKLVVEVQYDHFTGNRFRHGTKILRWRPDKAPEACSMDQVVPVNSEGFDPLAVAASGHGAAAKRSAAS